MIDILDLKPFEISSIKPPTENYSLTFRLTRNCYWNKCAFCPVYKLGAKFSKRDLKDVLKDISQARILDDFLFEQGIGYPAYTNADFERSIPLIEKIRETHWQAGIIHDEDNARKYCDIDYEKLDDRMKWFLTWFKDKPTFEDSINNIITWRMGGSKNCFLGDGDNLILKPDFIKKVVERIKQSFPVIERFTIYGKTRTAARQRSLKELKQFADAPIHRVHFGLESGSDEVLKLVNKGATQQEHIDGCLKVKEAGMSCSLYIMPGLGGKELSQQNAEETAKVLSIIKPDFVRIRSLEIFPGTPLEEMQMAGTFTLADEEDYIREIRHIIAETDGDMEILSDSASNLLNIYGNLPQDRSTMLQTTDNYLALSNRERLEFSLQSRLASFMGQYGDLSRDIYEVIEPMLINSSLDTSQTSDNYLKIAITLIRSKLMP